MKHARLALIAATLILTGAAPPPSDSLGPLFERVAMAGVFEDGKAWADQVAGRDPAAIRKEYEKSPTMDDDALRRFVAANFASEPPPPSIAAPNGRTLLDHIDDLWPLLTRCTPETPRYSSRLPLPNPYVVPGGRFGEIYYWDSYFTMLGFGPAQAQLRNGMVANFAAMIDRFGHIPNGNRSYYLSRTQPPFFYAMVGLTAPGDEAKAYAAYLPQLIAEHRFWMRGSEGLRSGAAAGRVVRMPDGELLNRYWDDRDVPRDESYAADVATARASNRPTAEVYRHIRAAAESGWDFSGRWFADGQTLATIETADIVPPDLNALLYGLERAIAKGAARMGDLASAKDYATRANSRAKAMRRWLWHAKLGVYTDFNWRNGKHRDLVTAAALYPLFTGVASPTEARSTALATERWLLKPGGLVATPLETGQQWDAPNGWAPLHWVAIAGLRRYGEDKLAADIRSRWLTTVTRVYGETGKLLEKYDVVTARPGGGGEYPLQDGFGWTNGVTAHLLREKAR